MKHDAQVAVLSDEYVFRGVLSLPAERRTSDILNNTLADVIELNRVRAYQMPDHATPQQKLTSLVLRKKHILVVAILAERDEVANKRLVQRLAKASANGHIYVGAVHIRGELIFSGKQKADTLTLRENDWFVPLRRAQITRGNLRITAPIVLVNNERILGFQYEAGDTKPTNGQYHSRMTV